MPDFSIGVDLGGTNLRIAAVSRDGELLEKVTLGTKVSLGPGRTIDEMCDAIQRVSAKHKESGKFLGAGIGVLGIIDMQTGTVRKSANFPGWENYPVRAENERRLRACALLENDTRVVLENDANMAALGEATGQGHAKPAGEMVVAGPRQTQRLVAHPCRPIARRPRDRDRHDLFEHARNLRATKPEITVAAASLVSEQPRLDQLCQMRARGLRGHMSDIGEFASAQRAAVHQRRQHVRARRVANQCGDLGDVGSVSHVTQDSTRRRLVGRKRFGRGRSYGRTACRAFR